MFDPFGRWERYMAAGASLHATGIRAATTLANGGQVVAARGDIMAEAVRSPWTADLGELGRMMPEKVEAFSRAALGTTTVCLDAQRLWTRHFHYIGLMTMRGRLPTLVELGELGEQSAELMLQMAEASAKAGAASLAPVRKQVAANVRRLKTRNAFATRVHRSAK